MGSFFTISVFILFFFLSYVVQSRAGNYFLSLIETSFGFISLIKALSFSFCQVIRKEIT